MYTRRTPFSSARCVSIEVAVAGVERDVLHHRFVRKEPDTAVAAIDRLTLRERQHRPAEAETLGGRSNRHVVEQHGVFLRDEDDDSLDRTVVLDDVHAARFDQGAVVSSIGTGFRPRRGTYLP
jgi:hypothetical protein